MLIITGCQIKTRYYNGKFTVQIFDGTNVIADASHTFTPTVGQWYHAAFTTQGTDGSVLRFYLNGIEEATGTLTGNVKTGTRSMILGYPAWDFGPTSLSLIGTIDEVMIYNRALTTDEITQIYDAQK